VEITHIIYDPYYYGEKIFNRIMIYDIVILVTIVSIPIKYSE